MANINTKVEALQNIQNKKDVAIKELTLNFD